MDIELGAWRPLIEACGNREKELHHSPDCFHPKLTEVIISAKKKKKEWRGRSDKMQIKRQQRMMCHRLDVHPLIR